MTKQLPVAIIGAGPIGLAAAARVLERGLRPLILEAGPSVGYNLSRWGHIRMFSPWSYNIDDCAAALLADTGWQMPDPDALPTGQQLLTDYLLPLSSCPQISAALHTSSRVKQISRRDRDVLKSAQRESSPFVLRVESPQGQRDVLAHAVIDASGTYQQPNWLGVHGMPALGECEAGSRIDYGVPDILGAGRHRYEDKTTLVVGSGHSAFNALQSLAEIAAQNPATRILWGLRGAAPDSPVTYRSCDPLKERSRLEAHIQSLLQQQCIELHSHIAIDAIESTAEHLKVQSRGQYLPAVHNIIAATGFRPDLGMLSELRCAIDSATQAPLALAPLIDPNLHSCGSVPEHGAEELAHPEHDFYIVGIKSYGRAPTFLLRTGYEQLRSVIARLETKSALLVPSAPSLAVPCQT